MRCDPVSEPGTICDPVSEPGTICHRLASDKLISLCGEWAYKRGMRFVFGVLLCSLVPYFVLGLFSYPSTDDFEYANHVLQMGLFSAQSHVYTAWSGRFVATFLLSLNPVAQKWIWGYPLIPLFMLLGLWGALIFLVRRWLGKSFSLGASLFVATLGFSVYLNHMQNPVQGFYWLAGAVTYSFPLILMTLNLGVLLNLYRKGQLAQREWVFMVLVSLLTVGSNETAMLQWVAALTGFGLLFHLKHKKLPLGLIATYGLSLVGSVVVFLAPGNSVRSGHFEDAHRPFYALYRTVGACIEHFVQFLSLPLVLFSLVFIAWALNHRDKLVKLIPSQLSLRTTLGLWFLTMASGFFPAMWAMGGNPPKRVDNTTYFWYLIFWALTLVVVVVRKENFWLAKRDRFPQLFRQKWLIPLALVSLFAIGNHRDAWLDLRHAREFQAEWSHRQVRSEKAAAANPGSSVTFPPLRKRPKILFNGDLTVDPEDWKNIAWTRYFKLGTVQVVDHGQTIY